MRHEHGNRTMAALLPDGTPWKGVPYGYAEHYDTVNPGTSVGLEGHQGFKNYWLEPRGPDSQYEWNVAHHFGTQSISRLCRSFHAIDIAIKEVSTNKLLVDLHLMAPHGHSVFPTSASTNQPYTPVFCPNQTAEALAQSDGQFRGQRQIPLFSGIRYEPWDVDVPAILTGQMFRVTFNTPAGIEFCIDAPNCNQIARTTAVGLSARFMVSDFPGLVNLQNVGDFCTDPRAKVLKNCADQDAVHQYVDPTLKNRTIRFPTHVAGTDYYYRPDENAPMVLQPDQSDLTNYDNALQQPN
jgi:hypothetical protein